MKNLVIEWHRLLDEQEKTCPRCGSTEQELEKAVAHLKKALDTAGIDVTLIKKSIDNESFKKDALQSNRIMIAGKSLEDWLGASSGQSKCCDVCGDSDCRTVEYNGLTHEAVPSNLVIEASLLAASQLFHVTLPQMNRQRLTFKLLSNTFKGKTKEVVMEIKVLGPGCANCTKMEEMAKEAIKELGIEASVEKVSDMREIMKYTMSTPGLVINGKLKHSGKPLPSGEKVKELIKSEA